MFKLVFIISWLIKLPHSENISSSFWLHPQNDATVHSQQLEQQIFAYAISFDDSEKWEIVSGAAFFKYFRSQLLPAFDYLAELVFLLLSTPFLSGSLSFGYKYPFFRQHQQTLCVNFIVRRTCESVNSTITCEKPPERLESESLESGLSRPGVNHHRESALCSRYFYFVTICLSSRCSRVLIIGPYGVFWLSWRWSLFEFINTRHSLALALSASIFVYGIFVLFKVCLLTEIFMSKEKRVSAVHFSCDVGPGKLRARITAKNFSQLLVKWLSRRSANKECLIQFCCKWIKTRVVFDLLPWIVRKDLVLRSQSIVQGIKSKIKEINIFSRTATKCAASNKNKLVE